MRVKEVGIGSPASPAVRTVVGIGRDVGQQLSVKVVRPLSLVQTRPKIDTPTRTPSRCLVPFELQRASSRPQQRRIPLAERIAGPSCHTSQMTPRIQAYQVGLMAVTGIPVVPVVVPLVEITSTSDRVGMQPFQGRPYPFVGFSQNLFCRKGIEKKLTDDGEVGGSTV